MAASTVLFLLLTLTALLTSRPGLSRRSRTRRSLGRETKCQCTPESSPTKLLDIPTAAGLVGPLRRVAKCPCTATEYLENPASKGLAMTKCQCFPTQSLKSPTTAGLAGPLRRETQRPGTTGLFQETSTVAVVAVPKGQSLPKPFLDTSTTAGLNGAETKPNHSYWVKEEAQPLLGLPVFSLSFTPTESESKGKSR